MSKFILRPLTRLILRLIGWRTEVTVPVPAKCVIVGAHHTTNMDFFMTLFLLFDTDLRFNWIAKDSAFRWPLGWVMRRLGGIPVVRSSRNNFVQQVVDRFNASSSFRVAIAPEGTRRGARYWKSGFYYIALNAGVPIMLGYADYARKVVGIGGQIIPSGNIHADMEAVARFYEAITPRFPHQRGEVRVQSDSSQ
ncbi:MAG: lysophospholipid acyltransferase family protein [Caldilineales bacterium]